MHRMLQFFLLLVAKLLIIMIKFRLSTIYNDYFGLSNILFLKDHFCYFSGPFGYKTWGTS